MGTAVLLVALTLVGTLAGWAGHWLLHRPWSGPLFRAHLLHHSLYPPSDFESDSYRGADWRSSVFSLGTLVGLAVVAVLAAARWLGLGWGGVAAGAAWSAALGWAHNWAHDSFHLRGHWMLRWRWFRRLKCLHLLHHRHARKNLGILWMDWDRAFGTMRER
jgi:hypothetical protein